MEKAGTGLPFGLNDEPSGNRLTIAATGFEVRRHMTTASLSGIGESVTQGYFLALFDIKSRYVRSVLGPFWITLSAMIFIFSIGFVWSFLFKVPLSFQLPFMAMSYTIWIFFQGTMLEATSAFQHGNSYVRDRGANWLTFCFFVYFRHLIYLVHSIGVGIVLMWWFGMGSVEGFIEAIPGLIVFLVFVLLTVLPIAMVSTRFRDIRAIIESSAVMLFLLTPVTWSPTILSERGAGFVQYNPFAQLMAVWRDPMLFDSHAPMWSWFISMTIIIILVIANYISLRRIKNVAFWV